MRLRSLTLENLRKFGGKEVCIDGIGDGITVISEANEFGKSTFFDAIHAVFFEKYTASGKSVKSLQPHAGGGVRISVDVEIDGTCYTLEKRFLSRKGASVTLRDTGRVLAREGEAEDWIARHIGAPEQGPAGLLWVRQGVLGLEPADSGRSERERLTEARRDLLSSVAGEIEQVTGGRVMDRIQRRVQEDLDALATGARLSPKGKWKEAVEAEKELTETLEHLDRQCRDLADALRARKEAEAELNRLDDPAARQRREADLAQATAAHEAAERHQQEVDSAEKQRDLAAMKQAEATRQRAAFDAAVAAATDIARDLTEAEQASAMAAKDVTTLTATRRKAQQQLETAEAATGALRQQRSAAERAEKAARARREATRLQERLAQLNTQRARATEARAAIAQNPASGPRLHAAEDAATALARLEDAAAARAARLEVAYTGTGRLHLNGKEIAPDTGVPLTDGAEIDAPGIGTLRFALPGAGDDSARQTALADARQQAEAALAACDAPDLATARRNARARQEAENTARLAEEMCASLAPEGAEALEAHLAELRHLSENAGETTGDLPDLAQIAEALEQAQDAETEARARLSGLSEQLAGAQARAAAAETAAQATRAHQQRLAEAAGPEAERASRHATLTRAETEAQTELTRAQTALDALLAAAPDSATARANLDRARTAHENARKRREALVERRADLSARIDTRAEEGVEERRNEVAGNLDATRTRAARFAAEVEALARLRDTLQDTRAAAREAYFEPVQEELRPLLQILHDDAGLDWEPDSITPGALRRGDTTEDYDTLSGGTKEQIAILTRLAFARLFARQGQHVPIILDDALVYSDDDRIVKMFTALNRVALEQQIIVFSCRQMAFAGLGGSQPAIRITETG